MKTINNCRTLAVLLLVLFMNPGVAQTDETLTNTTIIKMVRAHLSDDLIIDEISNSKVNFSLGTDSIASLSNANVSGDVIDAMKSAQQKQNPAIVPPPVAAAPVVIPEPLPAPVSATASSPVPVKTDQQEMSSGNSVTAISYVIPLKDMFTFYDDQIIAFNSYIQKWDSQVRKSLESEMNLMANMILVQEELTEKKNASAKPFNEEIFSLKAKLAKYREEHEQLKAKIRADGVLLAEELKSMSKAQSNLIGNKFIELNKNIKKVSSDPAVGEFPEQITIPDTKINGDLIIHIAPLTTLPSCYRNEIKSLKDTIVVWTEKVRAIIQRDAVLKNQLEPLNTRLAQYMSESKENQKLNKMDMTALKKQCDNLTKERKDLAKKMEKECDILSTNMNELRDELIFVLTERFQDAIENVQFSYQDKF